MLNADQFIEKINPQGRDLKRIREAYDYGLSRHEGQLRKFSGLPYFIHPIRVALIVRDHDDDIIIASLLHDVVEDTNATIADIESRFGLKVASLVKGMTKTDDTTIFEAIDSVIDQYPEIVMIKIADRIDNLSDNFDKLADSTKQRYKEETPMIIEYAESRGLNELTQELKHLYAKILE